MRFGRVRQQSDRARPLERGRQRALMPRAGPGYAARKDLAAVADEPPQPRDLLVVDVADLLDAEAADLAMLPLRSSRAATARLSLWTWAVRSHQLLLLLTKTECRRDRRRAGRRLRRERHRCASPRLRGRPARPNPL